MKKILLIIILTMVNMACDSTKSSNQEEEKAAKKLKVFAVNYPLFYFAERIGGPHVELIYPIPNDVDPAYWVPREDLDKIQNADLILTNGANYAKWMEKVSLPASKVINTSEAFAEQYIKLAEGTTHSHGGAGEHVHYGFAFTTWLDFKIATGQAKAVLNALMLKMPHAKETFIGNFEKLKSELLALDAKMTALSTKLPKKAIFASHPVYQYLGEAYGLTIISEHWEPGEEPTTVQWSEFKHNLDHNPANIMLWEGTPTDETRSKLQSLGVNSILFSPSANTPATGDFMSIMNQNITSLNSYLE